MKIEAKTGQADLLGPASSPELKAAFEEGFEEIISASGGDREEAMFRLAAMIGGVVLARAVQDPRLSGEILSSVRQKLG